MKLFMQPPQSIEEIKAGLETTEKGGVRQSIRNCLTVFQRDPLLSGAIAYNILTDRKDIMVNAMYAKDISKKIWTSLQRKKEAGYAVGNDAPYGYIRNPVTKRNEIDPEAAFYVQLIFQWELMGVPIFEIARRMTLLQVPTPREWHRKMVEGKEVLACKKWGVTTIRHILENQTYVGDTM